MPGEVRPRRRRRRGRPQRRRHLHRLSVTVPVPGELLTHRVCLRHPVRLQERLDEAPIAQRERRQRPCLPGQQARIVERATQDEPRHWVDVRRHRLAPEPHRFQRNRPAARERVQHPRHPPPERLPDLRPELASSPPSSRPQWKIPPRVSSFIRSPLALGASTTRPAIRASSLRRSSRRPGSGSSVASNAARLAANGRRAGQMCSVEMCPCRTFFSCTESRETCLSGNAASINLRSIKTFLPSHARDIGIHRTWCPFDPWKRLPFWDPANSSTKFPNPA